MHLARQIGGISVRGNHDEIALERYEMWKKCGRLDVSAPTPIKFYTNLSYDQLFKPLHRVHQVP